MPDESNVIQIGEPGPLTLAEKQAEMKERIQRKKRGRGNPNLAKGERPYNINGSSFRRWLEDNPAYERESKRSSGELVKQFLIEVVNTHGEPATHRDCGEERIHKLLKSLFSTATNGKSRNQVLAAQLLMAYGLGKPQSSDADLKAISKGGITMVYVNRLEIDPEIPVSQQALTTGEPEFIDAEVVGQ